MTGTSFSRRWRDILAAGMILAAAFTVAAKAQPIEVSLGVDPRVDYASFTKIGPWDDRNYRVTKEELALLAANEHELKDPIPVFFRIEMRKQNPGMPRTGIPQYPRSALQIFKMRYGGYLVGNKLYKSVVVKGDRFEVVLRNGITQEEFETKALTSDVKITSPTGAAESAVKIHPTDVNKVVAGSNGPGSGQKMWFSTNGGSTWTQSAALPQGSTCCDPTVDWSSNGQFAYTSTLGGCGAVCNVWVYRSSDGGATWNDLATITPGDGRREITASNTSDKQYLHVDKFATSSFKDNLYHCWHDNNVLKFSRSTDFAHTWSAPLTMSSGTSQSGIGCDLTTDKSGNLYYFWPATNGKTILMRKSTNGGTSFNTAVTASTTTDGYDFAIPAMETRRAFIYASADADLSSGSFANSVYVAWTDTTAPETSPPANNHARIRIAYSRDGGATWTVRTPHETADANTVDRFHPWLGVGPDGKVYVMFYDTRRSPTRVGVDIFYSVSSDGGNTWPTPVRLTSVLSPQIDDSFEWGDYNGLDIVGNQLITIFTDNRNESGGGADSIDVYAAGLTVGGGGGNTAPTVTITAPANGASVTQGTSVSFSGTATDVEDGTISGSLTWTSSINGIIGSGASFSTSTLSVGTHTITASVTDSGGLPGSAVITLNVTAPPSVTPGIGPWYNPARSGNGVDFQPAGPGRYVAVWYTYRANGTPTWYISDVAPLLGTSWRAPLYASTWDGTHNHLSVVGSLAFTFTDPRNATMSWSFTQPGTSGAEPFTWLEFDTGPTGPANGTWYPPSQSGWGASVWQQGSTFVFTSYTYDPSGQPTWAQGVALGSHPSSVVINDMNQFTGGNSLCPGCTGTGTFTTLPGAGTVWFRQTSPGQALLDIDLTYRATPGVWRRTNLPFTRLTGN